MVYTCECSLERFPAWSGGKDTLDVLIDKGDCDDVECLIESSYDDEYPTDTSINDFLWFERDFIAQHLGYKNWYEYENGRDEEDEDD